MIWCPLHKVWVVGVVGCLTCGNEAVCKTEEINGSEGEEVIQELLLLFICSQEGIVLVPLPARQQTNVNVM